MAFTFEFIQLFLVSLWYAAPLIGLLAALIIALGHVIGTREGWSRGDSIYHAFIAATTVGYGDFHPKKSLSKVLAVIISFVGIILTGIIVALALYAVERAFRTSPDYQHLLNRIEQIERSYMQDNNPGAE